MNYYGSIDLGTTSVKVLIIDIGGKVMGKGQSSYSLYTPEIGYAQQEPEEWWQAVRTAMHQALLEAKIKGEEVKCIGFSGQMHGLTAIDRDGKVVRPAIIWMDQRTAEEVEIIKDTASQWMTTELLNAPTAGMLLCSLLWMKKKEPAAYDRIWKVMCPKDYIRYRLTGRVASDNSDASATLAFSVKNKHWCMEMIRALDLREDVWPEVHASYELGGCLTKEAAEEMGLSVKTQVVYGGGDSAMQLIGNGVVEEGIISCNIGTASQLAATVGGPFFDPQMRCQTWCHGIPDMWNIQGGALNGGSTMNWLRNKILRTDQPFYQLDEAAGEIDPGSEGLLFLPYLAGERTPFANPRARGTYFGLTMKHEQSHMVRATMEGVVFNLKECGKIFSEIGVESRKMIASGGGAHGKTWRQIQADIFQMPVYTTKVDEEAGLGAAIMAAVGMGEYADVTEACQTIVKMNEEVIEPIQEHAAYYESRLEIFHRLYENTKDLLP